MATPGAAPARLGRYELLARLAAGGMGEIFLARLEGAAGFEKLFVVKRILPHMADDARFRAMLIAEARIASMMAHANICQVYELGETDGQLYIVMEYLEGITLLPLLRKLSKDGGALELGFAAGVIQQVTDALHYAHELRDRGGGGLGIVHRDVTPTNLFVTDAGVIKVLDFGIAKVKDISAHTQTGTVKGKYAYMAPEQLRGAAAIDRRADVFALGVVVYEMLALRRLFQRKTDYLTFRAVMEQPIIDVRRYRPDCPEPLAIALSRALDRDPAGRFATARQFGSAVLDAIGGLTRPWSHGEISDFVRVHFADEMAARSAKIASALRTSGPRIAVPLIAPSDDESTEVEDDGEEFPTVNSDVSDTPIDARHLRPPSSDLAMQPTQPGPAGPAGSAEPSPSGIGLDALRATGGTAPLPSIVMVSQRRSLLWPMVAIAGLGIAGVALFLVWRQTQIPPQSSWVITHDRGTEVDEGGSNTIIVGSRSSGDRAGEHAADPVGKAPGSDPGKARGGDPGKARVSASEPRPAHKSATVAAPTNSSANIEGQMLPGLNQCAATHGDPPAGTIMTLVVGPDGRAKQVTFQPSSVDDGPLGACIRDVVKGVAFSRALRDYSFPITLHRRA